MTYPLKEEVSAEYALQLRIYLPSSTDTDTELPSARAVEEENENTAIIIVTMRATEITDIYFLEREGFIFFCVFRVNKQFVKGCFFAHCIFNHTHKREGCQFFFFKIRQKPTRKRQKNPKSAPSCVDKIPRETHIRTAKSTILRFHSGKTVNFRPICPQNFQKMLDIIKVNSYNKIYLL